ncbi:SprT-like domain-containing protein [Leptospira yasudae]|uniref:M48 family peptidase n=1 Tax=Leptospira yasudae TaxID=2202201 RepID=A0A6N4QLG8_9LEPT|nr:SprT-like domain-containing protein [Leptospira yasudae]TGL82242.1 M48 family peptidase [Leptospira yasudae]TGL84430.1 M48 family peptidase [Leptospira yasudae]TGL89087.1 M48 family peptidase [Leptospira yasudae]
MVFAFETRGRTNEESSVLELLRKRTFHFLKVPGGKILEGKRIAVKFYPYANLGSSIRISAGKLEFKIHSSYLSADSEDLEAVVDLLLYKLLKQSIPQELDERIRRFYETQSETKRQKNKNRKRIERSSIANEGLREIMDRLNDTYLRIDLNDLEIFWSKSVSKTRLGHFDPAHRMIVINPILSREIVPAFVLEYIVFHELLHVVFPVTRKNGKNVIHGRDFKTFERKFPDYKRANAWLKSKFYQNMILRT